MPSSADLLQEGLALHRSGAIAEAAARYADVLRAEPNNADAHYYLGTIACQGGRFTEGIEHARNAVAADPQHARAHILLGRAYGLSGQQEDALAHFDRAITLDPDAAQAHASRADLLSDMGRKAEAIESYDRALALAADVAEDWFNRGLALNALARHEEAVASFDRAVACKSDFARAHLQRAETLLALDRPNDALAGVDRALSPEPDFANAWLCRGKVLRRLKQYDDASDAFDKAISLNANMAGAWLGRGNLFCAHAQYQQALSDFDKALSLKPDLAEAWLGKSLALNELGLSADALAASEKALDADPFFAEAWLGHAIGFLKLRKYEEALAAFDRALQLKPDLEFLQGLRLHVKLLLCDWNGFESDAAELLSAIRTGRLASTPFEFLCVPSHPSDQLQCALRYMRERPVFRRMSDRRVYSHDRLRIAYLSADFQDHATAPLLAGLFEQHDRSRFDVTGISFGPGESSPMHDRIKGAFEHFFDVREKSELDIAELVRQLEIDIAIDLMGHTQNARTGIFARRAAPIQVSYLGYLGTTGTDYIDYVLTDKIAVPFDQQPYYTEKIVHLPDCFVAGDRLEIASQTPSRPDAGLPRDGFVFCSFNNSYKLNGAMFDLWMRLLRAVEGSVLWLAESNTPMVINLRREAERRGVAAERLVFAPRVPLAEHLARHRLAGLFLDTTPYNAGATATLALWAGLPIVTMLGETFVGRMAASMLHAVGLPELIAESMAEYEALAIRIAGDPALCVSLKAKLAHNHRICPLFDTRRFTRGVEAAYSAMWQRHQHGGAAASFAVEAHD